MLTHTLLTYYQKELHYLRSCGKRFALAFPGLAKRLGMAQGDSEDPHVERIIESFALISARIHQRLDEDLPEMSQAILSVLAPNFMRTFPSACIVQFQPDRKISGLTTGCTIAAGQVLHSHLIHSEALTFRTINAITLLPISLDHADMQYDENGWCLTLRLAVWGKARLDHDRLRFWIQGPFAFANAIYALLCSQVRSVVLRTDQNVFTLPVEAIQGGDMDTREAMLGDNSRLQPAFGMLTDFFAFPQQFHFIDITLPPSLSTMETEMLEFCIRFQQTPAPEKLATLVSSDTFRLHCAAAVNLFAQRAEPITPYPSLTEYPVVPDIRRGSNVEVWSVDGVTALHKTPQGTVSQQIPPLYGINLDSMSTDSDEGLFWHYIQRSGVGEDGATSFRHSLAFCDRGRRVLSPIQDVLIPELTCTNGVLPTRMNNGQPDGDFDCTLPFAGMRIRALTRPTKPVPPSEDSARLWALISQFSLKHMSISGPEGATVLRKTLAIYNPGGMLRSSKLIALISDVRVSLLSLRLETDNPFSLSKGLQIVISFSDEAQKCDEYFLFCRVLEQFMALYAPVNSFTRVTTQIAGQEGTCLHWPVRSGITKWL